MTFEMHLRRWSHLRQGGTPRPPNLFPTARRRRSGFEIVNRPIVGAGPALGKGLLPATQCQKVIQEHCSVSLHCVVFTILLSVLSHSSRCAMLRTTVCSITCTRTLTDSSWVNVSSQDCIPAAVAQCAQC